MSPLQQEADALALEIATAETAYDQAVKLFKLLRGPPGRRNFKWSDRLKAADDDMERQADALRAMRTRLDRLQARADRQQLQAIREAERARQGVLL